MKEKFRREDPELARIRHNVRDERKGAVKQSNHAEIQAVAQARRKERKETESGFRFGRMFG